MSEYCKNCKILQDKLDIAVKALKDIDFVFTQVMSSYIFIEKVRQIKDSALEDLKNLNKEY